MKCVTLPKWLTILELHCNDKAPILERHLSKNLDDKDENNVNKKLIKQEKDRYSKYLIVFGIHILLTNNVLKQILTPARPNTNIQSH